MKLLGIPAGVETPLGKRLVALSLFRLGVLGVFLLVTELYYLKELDFGGFSSQVAVYTLGIAFLISAAYAVVLRRGRRLDLAAHAQLITDQLVWTAIVYISGGVTSGSASLYGLTCLSGAILLGTPGAVSAAAAGISCYLALCTSFVQGWLPVPPDQTASAYVTKLDGMVYPAFSTVMAIAVVTLLAAYLAERLRAFGGRLEAATQRAEQAERLAALGRLTAGLAHEIRNPLGSIRGSIELLRTGGALAREDNRLCEIVEREASRLDDLVTDMINLSRPRPPVLRELDLAETAQTVVKLAQSSARGGEVEVAYQGPKSLLVIADAGQMHQVLWNLVRNAMQASSEGTNVAISLVKQPEGSMALAVRDKGPGIPDSKREHIFDAFFTTRSHGMGIGLAVVKQIVEGHGFGLDLQSDEENGTTFEVSIPKGHVVALALLVFTLLGCSARDWVNPAPAAPDLRDNLHFWDEPPAAATAPPTGSPSSTSLPPAPTAAASSRVSIVMKGNKRSKPSATTTKLFRNTYYDFPSEPTWPEHGPTRQLFNLSCKPIRTVSQAFHDQLCVQGSGRLATAETVSFGKRNCACAANCPRTGQKICYELLDKKKFPFGRGATGKPITPLRSVAVDSKVIALGSILYIPAYHGLRDMKGKPHDGCFIAQDRGLKVRGHHVDIFTGDPKNTRVWNAAVPSNLGVRVVVGASKCAYLRKK